MPAPSRHGTASCQVSARSSVSAKSCNPRPSGGGTCGRPICWACASSAGSATSAPRVTSSSSRVTSSTRLRCASTRAASRAASAWASWTSGPRAAGPSARRNDSSQGARADAGELVEAMTPPSSTAIVMGSREGGTGRSARCCERRCCRKSSSGMPERTARRAPQKAVNRLSLGAWSFCRGGGFSAGAARGARGARSSERRSCTHCSGFF